jgi:hypothetical protein
VVSIIANERKLLSYDIFKRKTMPKGYFPSQIHIRVQEKGWMVSKLTKNWFHNVWGRCPGHLLQHRLLLVLNSFHGHLVDDITKTNAQHEGGYCHHPWWTNVYPAATSRVCEQAV